jgi:hypothetical protein
VFAAVTEASDVELSGIVTNRSALQCQSGNRIATIQTIRVVRLNGYGAELCTTDISTAPTPRPTAINVSPVATSLSFSRWSPIMNTTKPTAMGIAPIVIKAAKGTSAQTTLNAVTRQINPNSE